MQVKDRWTDADFGQMGWHDCRIYSITLPDEDFSVRLDIDYLFHWQEQPNKQYKFWVSPCDLRFLNVSGFSASLDYGNSTLLFISDLKRRNPRLSTNGETTVWEYEIDCNLGTIALAAISFEQVGRSQLKASETQDLGRGLHAAV